MTITRINPTPRWSDATVFNGIGHFVEIADNTCADLEGQIKQVLQQAEKTLAKINSSHSRLLSATIYLTDFSHLSLFNEYWDAWLPQGCAPSRACVKAELADPDYLVEIAFVAAVKQD
ncbi:RidA family protein [Shewanella sp. AS1]|uniref:RidA family protein n=1 Tax=Shewanella sp. AS1 TaxID=2907626 RepID=UPI001F2D4204|nr:RidA family protein [Shewanella sp. AS1]MCE9678140.1 RidA family protein [Shewanella sp. AS1]